MFVRYYRFVEMSEEDLDKETIGRKVSERSKSFPTRKLFFQLAESLPFELLEEYRQIFSFFDRWSNDEARNDQCGDEWFDYDKLFDEGFSLRVASEKLNRKIQFKI